MENILIIYAVWTNSIETKMPNAFRIFLTFICLLCMTVHACNSLLDSALFLHHVGPGKGTQVVRLGSKFLYPLYHLTSPVLNI